MGNSTEPVSAWSAVADAWDENVEEVDDHSADATAALLDRLQVRAGDRVLELAAGPGSLGRTWSQLVGTTGAVVLSDIAPAMVEVARRRNAGIDNIETARIDASSIDRPDGTFDVVACRMGLMFVPDPHAALVEIRRVLSVTGRLGVLTWGRMEQNPWMTCVGMAAMATGLVHGGPPIGPGGIFSLGDPAQLEVTAKDAGFADIAVQEIAITFRATSIDAHIDRVVSLAGPLAVELATATPEQLAAMRGIAADLAAPYVTEDGVAIPGQALLLSARR